MATADLVRSNFEKCVFHLDRAEAWQARAEALEARAEKLVAGQQQGRMTRADGSLIDIGFMVKVALRDNDEYAHAVGMRNSHQTQANMYANMHQANIPPTQNPLDRDSRRILIPQPRTITQS